MLDFLERLQQRLGLKTDSVIFFTTSSDSASLVVDMLCVGEDERGSPVRQRVFWAVTEGVVAGTLIAATGTGGLTALEQVITVVGLPFFVIAGLMVFCIHRALREDFPQLSSPPKELLEEDVKDSKRRELARRAKQGAQHTVTAKRRTRGDDDEQTRGHHA